MNDKRRTETTDAGSVQTYAILRKTGRRSNGREADRGPVYHAVPRHRFHAACGTEPGDRSDWSTYPGDAVTCSRCLSVMKRWGLAAA